MKPKKASIESAKQLLSTLSEELRETVVALQVMPQKEKVLQAIETSQKIVEIMETNEAFVSLIPLVQNLVRYFKTVQEVMFIKKSHLEVLSMIIGELLHLGDIKTKIQKTIHDRQTDYDQLKDKLIQFIHEFEVEYQIPEGITTEKKEEIPTLISDQVDQALITLFLTELVKQIDSLKKHLTILHTNPNEDFAIESCIQTVREIKQAAKIIHEESMAELAGHLELFFREIKDKNINFDSHAEKMMSQILNFLIELSTTSPDKVDVFLKEHTPSIAELHQKVEQQQKEVSTKPQRIEEAKKELKPLKDLSKDISFDSTMFNLFNIELETQCKVLNEGLIELERKPKDAQLLQSLMRAAHSIKGAARVVNLDLVVSLAHKMEDCFVAAQNNQMQINVELIESLLRSVDFFSRLSRVNAQNINIWIVGQKPFIETLIQNIPSVTPTEIAAEPQAKKTVKQLSQKEMASIPIPSVSKTEAKEKKILESKKIFQTSYTQDRMLRITAQNLNRLMGLAGEYLVESRWFSPFEESLLAVKNNLTDLTKTIDLLKESLSKEKLAEKTQRYLTELKNRLSEIRLRLVSHLGELDSFIRRDASLSDRLYQEVINSRMRPFADGVEGFPRMVRDLAHQMGKRIRLEIEGKATPVDRDILERLESPLSHLLRNAVDHGIELPEERVAAGKSSEGTVKLEAHHRGGMLAITVSDDGRGIDINQLRKKIVEKNLTSAEMAQRLTDEEVIDFLFLPGFSTSASVTEVSGRGVGLNIVQNIVQEVGGEVRTVVYPGKGMSFHLLLPLTLSVIRALLVEISGEVYAFPLARIDHAIHINRENILTIENREYFHIEGENIGLVSAWQVLDLEPPIFFLTRLPVIIISDRENSYGIVVDRLIGEKELVVQDLDPALGKVPDIIAGALMEDGTPVLIIDIEDIVRSIDKLLSGGKLQKLMMTEDEKSEKIRKRILVVDDSITVREVESRLLQSKGYEVETAVNGIDGWNAVRVGNFDLIITDIDMPRMNGIELLKAIKGDPKLQHLPVMIVSYKEAEADRLEGLAAGAKYFLTKGSFQDDTLINAVQDLIGMP